MTADKGCAPRYKPSKRHRSSRRLAFRIWMLSELAPPPTGVRSPPLSATCQKNKGGGVREKGHGGREIFWAKARVTPCCAGCCPSPPPAPARATEEGGEVGRRTLPSHRARGERGIPARAGGKTRSPPPPPSLPTRPPLRCPRLGHPAVHVRKDLPLHRRLDGLEDRLHRLRGRALLFPRRVGTPQVASLRALPARARQGNAVPARSWPGPPVAGRAFITAGPMPSPGMSVTLRVEESPGLGMYVGASAGALPVASARVAPVASGGNAARHRAAPAPSPARRSAIFR